MGDRESSFVIRFDGEAGTVKSILAALKAQIKSDVSDIQATADKLDVFRTLQQQTKDAATAFFSTKQRVEDLRAAVDAFRNSGGVVGADLTKSLKDAERAAASARKEFDSSRDRLATLRTELTKAGVDTKNLAGEQQRLAAATREAALAAAEQQQKQALGFKTLKDVSPELARLRANYLALRDSGKLSFTELTALQGAYQKQVAEVRGTVSGLGSAFDGVKNNLAGFSVVAAAAGVSIGAVVAGLHSAIEAARQYDDGLAAIGTITNLTKGQLDQLGAGAREIARDIGVDLNDALKGLYELIRSGVDPSNALTVLRTAAEAAKASFTDLGSGVKAANLLLDGFGASADQLPLLFDKIVKGAHGGGATLKEFADNAGPLLSVAKAAGIGFDDLVATLTVLTDKEGNASQATADLTKIIAKLDTAEARDKLRQLGIEGGSLVSIFTQIGAKGLGINEILNLGIASTKSAAGISALTKNSGDLLPALRDVQTAAGTTADAVAKIYDTPAERIARFNAALHETAVTIGQAAGAGAGLATIATVILNGFNLVYGVLLKADQAITNFAKSFVTQAADAARSALGLETSTSKAEKATRDFADANDRLAQRLRQTAEDAVKTAQDLGDFGKRLLQDVQEIQAALARNVVDLNADAAVKIAALDRSLAASKATADATLQIETKLAADRLAVIVKAEAEITAAIDKTVAARAASVKKGSDDEKNLAKDTAAARIAALQPVLAQYQTHYNSLVQQAQTAAQQIRDVDQQRVDFNRGIEQQLFNIRLEGLSAFDQYTAKVQEADRLIGESEKAAALGTKEGAAQAQKFANEAIGLANQLGEVTDQNGVKVFTALQSQQTKLGIVERASKAVNQSYDAQAIAAKNSFEAAEKGIDAVKPKLDKLKETYDQLKATVATGLDVKVTNDEASFTRTKEALDELTRPREVTITVRQVGPDGTLLPPSSTGGGAGSGEHFASGGVVGAPRRFAGGGSVFRQPGWSKVPGIGNADTVPASLNAGSFVVRKSASQFYGDGIMSKLARGYAAGGSVYGMNDRSNGIGTGTVTKEQIQKYAENRWGYDPFSTAPIAANGFGPTNTASRFYDPGGIGNAPGRTGTTAPETDPKFGFRSGDTFQDKFEQRVISLDTRPIPEQYITATNVIEYAKEMLNNVGQNNPLLGSLGASILQGIQTLSSNPNNPTALTSLLQAAETVGSNPYLFAMWGKTAGSPAAAQVQPEWFIDWLTDRGLVDQFGSPTGGGGGSGGTGGGGGLPVNTSGLTGQPGSLLVQNLLSRSTRNFGNDVADRLLHPLGKIIPSQANNFGQKFFQTAIPAAGTPPFVQQRNRAQLDDLRNRLARPFAEGGGSTDTVPAMLTPGEFVVNKPAVDRIGAPLLWAINEMRLPKADLSHLLEAPRVHRFAGGGYVGVPESRNVSPGQAGGGNTINNIYVQASVDDIFSEANITRKFLPIWNGIQQRSRRPS